MTRMGRGHPAAWLVLALFGCGGDPAPDAGVDAGRDARVTVAPPDVPWLDESAPPVAPPALAPCPDGWREVPSSDDGPATCDPYPEGGARGCPAGETHFPGEPGCAPIGSACPSGEWADGLPDDGSVLFVRAGASGGDGTRAAPFGAIRDALPLATVGTTIALSAGRFTETFAMPASVTLRGACARDTVIVPDVGLGRLRVEVAGVTLRDLTIEDAGDTGVEVRGPDASATLDGVAITGPLLMGIYVDDGASLTARSIRVAGMDNELWGLGVANGASADVSRAVFEHNTHMAIALRSGGALTMRDAVVRDSRSYLAEFGRGLVAEEGASAELLRVLFERNRESALVAIGAGTSLRLSEAVVRGTRVEELTGLGGRAVALGEGARGELSRVLLEDDAEVALLADGAGTVLEAADLLIRDTRPDATGAFGRGLVVQRGATGTVERARLARNREVAVFVGGGSSAALTDVAILDTASNEDERLGHGVNVVASELTLERALLSGNREVGVFASGAGAVLDLVDVAILDTLERACAATTCADQPGGIATGAYDSAAVTVTRFVLRAAALCGLQVSRGGAFDLTSGDVADNRIGACLQDPSFDRARLMNDVRFLDNDTVFEATTFPEPEVATASRF